MNRFKSSEMNSHINGQLIFNNSVKTIKWKRIVFSPDGVETTGYPQAK